MKFKKFKQDEYECIDGHVMFVHDDGVARLGCLYEDYHGNGHSTFFFKADGHWFEADECIWCPVEVEK